MDVQEKISGLVETLLTDKDKFLVGVTLSGKPGFQKIKVIIDGDQGITIDDCSLLSRALSHALDEVDLIGEKYTLEVSTPGIDHPLKLTRQYIKNIGRVLKVHTMDKTISKGKLVDVKPDRIVLALDGEKQIDILFNQIEKALVQISFK